MHCPICKKNEPSMSLDFSFVAGTDDCGSTNSVRVPVCGPCGKAKMEETMRWVSDFMKQVPDGG